MKNKTRGKFIASILSVAMFATLTSGSVFATDVTGSGDVDSTINVTAEVTPVTIMVSVPTAITFAINPNNANTVTTVPANFTNNSKVGIAIEFLGFKAKDANVTKVAESTKFANWGVLGAKDTQENIAIALVDGANTYWSPVEPATLTTAPVIATLNLDAKEVTPVSKAVNLNVKTGNSWTKACTLSYDMAIRIRVA